MGAGALHHPDRVLLEPGVAVDRGDRRLAGEDLLDGGHRGQLLERGGGLEAVEHPHLLLEGEVADAHLDQEAVDLGLGEGEGAAELERLLGREHDEGLGEAVGDAVDGDLPLLHRLEQARLGLRGGAVDLVGEEHLGEDRAPSEFEGGGLGIEDVDPGDVTGEQVGGELDALEEAAEGAGQGLGELRLADPGDVLDEDVATAEEGDHTLLDLGLLAHDDRADTLDEPPDHLPDGSHHHEPPPLPVGPPKSRRARAEYMRASRDLRSTESHA